MRTFKGLYQSPTFWSEVPIQVAAEREIARYNFAQVGPVLFPSLHTTRSHALTQPRKGRQEIDEDSVAEL